jgi:8-oxo-dGTP pyrophosphatase MutT (NUDIX family)
VTWRSTGELLLPAASLPSWVQPVAQFASSTHVSQLTRFVPSEGEGRHAAVLILLGEGPEVVLVQRAGGDALHSGQPAFPGGVVEPSDTDPIDAALRETYEEIGVAREEVIPFALLPDLLIPVSDFVVSPVLALWSAPRAVTAQDLNEISSVHRVPIRDLAAADNRCSVRHPSGFLSPGFEVCSMLVWGFTAGILNGLLREAGWEEPWDSERVITLSG